MIATIPRPVQRVVTGLRAEAKRYEAAAVQQDKMAEWTSRPEPAERSRQRAFLLRQAANMLETLAMGEPL